MDLSTLAPTESQWTPAARGRKAQDKGPNPFVTNGWLKQTYETGKAQSVTVEGYWEEKDRKTRAGEDVTRKFLRGDAEEIVKLLRAAANELKIGVTLNVVPARKRGFVTVHFLGQKRKEYKKDK